MVAILTLTLISKLQYIDTLYNIALYVYTFYQIWN